MVFLQSFIKKKLLQVAETFGAVRAHLILEHVHVVVCCLWLLLCHLLQMGYQVWHVHPEILGIGLALCGGVAGGGEKHDQGPDNLSKLRNFSFYEPIVQIERNI